MSNPYTLEYWIGVEIGALIPMLSPNCISVTIRGVDAGGIWIECEQLIVSFCCGEPREEWDQQAKVVGFIPFAQITYLATLDRKQLFGPAQVLSFAAKPKAT